MAEAFKLVSVVIPVYNEEAGLDALIARVIPAAEAIFADRFELVLINDGSKDASWDVICKHAERDPRIVAPTEVGVVGEIAIGHA